MSTIQSEMLRMFVDGVPSYQPENMATENGDPQASLENMNRLQQAGLVISQIHVRPTGTLFLFCTGEQYYAPALRVGGDGRETEVLAELAADAGWGALEELLDLYHGIPQEYAGPLPDALPEHRAVRQCPMPNCPLLHAAHHGLSLDLGTCKSPRNAAK